MWQLYVNAIVHRHRIITICLRQKKNSAEQSRPWRRCWYYLIIMMAMNAVLVHKHVNMFVSHKHRVDSGTISCACVCRISLGRAGQNGSVVFTCAREITSIGICTGLHCHIVCPNWVHNKTYRCEASLFLFHWPWLGYVDSNTCLVLMWSVIVIRLSALQYFTICNHHR